MAYIQRDSYKDQEELERQKLQSQGMVMGQPNSEELFENIRNYINMNSGYNSGKGMSDKVVGNAQNGDMMPQDAAQQQQSTAMQKNPSQQLQQEQVKRSPFSGITSRLRK